MPEPKTLKFNPINLPEKKNGNTPKTVGFNPINLPPKNGNGKEVAVEEKSVNQTPNYDIFLKKQQVPFDIPEELKNIPLQETTPGVVFDSPLKRLTTPPRQWYEKPEAKAPELREKPIHSAYEPQPFPELTKKSDEIYIAENKLNKLADGLKKSKDSINLSDAEQVKLFNDSVGVYNQEFENYQKLVNDYNRSLGTIKSESKSEDDKYLEELRKKQPAYKNIPDSILLHSRNELQGFEPKKIQKYSKVNVFVLGLQDLVTTQIPESVDFTLGLISEGMRARNPQLSLTIDQTLRQPVQNFVAEQKKIREEYKPQDEFWYSIGNAVGTGAMAYVGGFTGALTGKLLKMGKIGTEVLSGVNSFANSFALEGGAAYGDAKQYGLSDQEAMRIGSIVGLVNAPLDVAPVLYGLKKFGITKAAVKEVQEEVAEKILNKPLREQILNGVKSFIEQSQIEAVTESMQEITPLIQEGLYKRAQDKPGFMDWYNRIGQSYIAGAFVGGLFAGGATTNQIIRENRALEVGELKPGATDLIATTLMNPKLQQEKQFDVRQQFIATQPQEEQSALRDLTGQQINVSGLRGDGFPFAQLELTEGRTEGRGRPIEKVAREVQIEQNRRANEELKLLEERKQRQAEKKQKRQEQLDEENYYRLERAVKNAIKNNVQFPEGQIAQLNDQVIKPAVKQKLENLYTKVLEHNKQAKLGAVEEVKTKTLEPEFADVDKQLAQKEQEILNRIKEAKNAVSKQSPTEIPIQPTPGSSEEIRQGDTEISLPQPTGTQEEEISTAETGGKVVPKAGEGEVSIDISPTTNEFGTSTKYRLPEGKHKFTIVPDEMSKKGDRIKLVQLDENGNLKKIKLANGEEVNSIGVSKEMLDKDFQPIPKTEVKTETPNKAVEKPEVKTGGEVTLADIKTHEEAISTRDAYMKQLIAEGKTDAEVADAMNKDLPVPTDEALKILRDIVNIEHKLRPAAKVKEELLNRLMPIKSWLNRQYGKLEDLSNEELVNLDKKFISKESQDRIAKLAYDSKDFNEFFGLMNDNDKMVLVAAGKVKYENRSFNVDDLSFFYERNKKPEQKEEPYIPYDGWRTNLIKARDYARALKIDFKEMKLEEIVAAIDKKLGAEKPLPSIKEITENVPNIKLVKIKEAESEIDNQIDDKIKQLLKKKGGQFNLSIDPEQLAIGVEIVGLYVKKGVYKLRAILEEVKAKYGFDNLRQLFEVIKQAYSAHYSTAEDTVADQMDDPKSIRNLTIDMFETETKVKNPIEKLRDRIAEEIKSGNQMNKTQLEKLAKEVAGIEDANLAKEIAESAVYKLGREIVTTSKTEEETLKKLTELYNNQPNLTHRTSESVRNQQYSTPIPISYVAGLWVKDTTIAKKFDISKLSEQAQRYYNDLLNVFENEQQVIDAYDPVGLLAKANYAAWFEDTLNTNLNNPQWRLLYQELKNYPKQLAAELYERLRSKNIGGKFLEPSAGTGLLTVALDPKTVTANEIDPVRKQMLEMNGFEEVTSEDASKPLWKIKGKFNGLLTNPPFGGLDQVERIDDYKIRKLEHLMVARGLHKLTDDGRGAIIIGGHNEYQQNGRLAKDEVFFNWLNHYYNVADVININGDLYSKQGTKFPIRLILIDGKKSTPSGVAPKFNAERETVINDFQSLYDRVKERRNEAILQPGLVGGTSGVTNVRSPGGVQTQGSQNVPPTQTGTTNQGSGTSIQPVSGQGGGRTTTQPSGSQQSEGPGTGTTGQPAVSQPNEPKGRGQGEPKPEGTEGDIRGTEGGESDTDLAEQVVKEEKPLIPYEPMSKSPGVDTHVPRTMYFETKKMLERLQKAVGNIDEYVRTKLNYDSLEDLFNAFSGEQIDGLALAIYNIDRGEGMIVGDQTGTGKGRQAAGLIRYANLIGLKPIFMTEKAKLFSDIYRDLVDIGSEDLTPFILNQPDAESNIVDENGTVIHRALSSEQKIKFFRNQDIEGFDFLVSTYSQINSERRASKRGFLSALAQDNILILDESHNAAGEGNTAAYMIGLVQRAKGVAFLSATYAKRPNNMPLYVSKTALNEANLNNEEIANAISDGGVALQEAVAQDLIEAGQMIRREKTFEGIKVEYQVFDHLKEQHTKTADTLTQIMRDIIAFQNEHVRPVVNDLDDDVAAGGVGIAQGTSQAGVDNTAFASKIFNVVNQMLFSIKAEETANLAIKLIKEGKKPIIACHNTMEAFLTNMGFQDEENIGVPDFSRVLQRGLDGVLRISVRDEQGNAEPDTIKVEDLSPEGQAEYHRIAEAIRVASTGISPSPIDIIIKKLEDAGYKIGEITGRDRRLQYNDDGTATVVRRGKVDSKKTLRDFNNQEFDKNGKSIHGFDALIINSSGAAGTSAHTSPKFKDTRPRAMINIQLQLNINTEVQVRGRINRTGQVNLPEYYTVASAIPAEQRMLMMAKKKLRSLDANTQAEQKRAGRYFESVDFINKYGDYIVWEYLKENPDFYNKVYPDDKLDLANKDEAEMADVAMPENIALKASGRVAILSVTEQEEFYNEIQQRYIDLIDYLDQMGENDLEMTFYPLDAKTTHSRILIAGKGGTSPFGRDSIVEDIEINVLKKPWKKEKIDAYLQDELKGKDKGKHRQDILHNFKQHFNENERTKVTERIETLKKRFKIEDDLTSLVDDIVRTDDLSGMNIDFTNKYFIKNQDIDSESLEGKRIQKINENLFSILSSIERDRDKAKWLIRNVFNEYNIGDVVKIPVVEGSTAYVNGIFAGWDINERSKNPYAPSAIKMKFITSDSRQMVTVPTSKRDFLNAIAAETYRLERFQKEDIFNDWDHNVSFKNREVRQFVTGNLLQGMAEVKHGKLISFSTNDGKIRRGILTPRDWAKGEVNDVKVPIMRAYEIIKNFKNGKSIESWNGNVEIIRDRNNFMVRFPASKKSGGKYYLDETLASLTTNKRFDKIGDSMVGYVKPDNLREFLKVLQNDFGEAVRLSEDELKKISKIYGSNTEQKRENGDDISDEERLDGNPVDFGMGLGQVFTGFADMVINRFNKRSDLIATGVIKIDDPRFPNALRLYRKFMTNIPWFFDKAPKLQRIYDLIDLHLVRNINEETAIIREDKWKNAKGYRDLKETEKQEFLNAMKKYEWRIYDDMRRGKTPRYLKFDEFIANYNLSPDTAKWLLTEYKPTIDYALELVKDLDKYSIVNETKANPFLQDYRAYAQSKKPDKATLAKLLEAAKKEFFDVAPNAEFHYEQYLINMAKPDEVTALQMVWQNMKDIREISADYLADIKYKELENRFYFPSSRLSNKYYLSAVKEVSIAEALAGEVEDRYYSTSDNISKLREIKDDLESQGYKVYVGEFKKAQEDILDNIVGQEDLLDLAQLSGIAEDNPVIDRLLKNIMGKGFTRHFIQKKYIPGFEYTSKNFESAMYRYMNSVPYFKNQTIGHKELEKAMVKLKRDKVLKAGSAEDDYIQTMLDGLNTRSSTVSLALRAAASVWYLAGRLSYYVQQIVQPFNTLLPLLPTLTKQLGISTIEAEKAFGSAMLGGVQYYSWKIMDWIARHTGKNYSHNHGLEQEFIDIAKRLDRQGVGKPLRTQELIGERVDPNKYYDVNIVRDSFVLFAKAVNFPGLMIEDFTRAQGMRAFYLLGKKGGLSGEELIKFISLNVAKSYGPPAGRLAKPPGYNIPSKATIAKAAQSVIDFGLTFKNFAFMNYGQWGKTYRALMDDHLFRPIIYKTGAQIGVGGLKYMAWTSTVLSFLSFLFGLLNIPKDPEEEYEKLFLNFNKLIPGMGDAMYKGVASVTFKVDLSNLFSQQAPFILEDIAWKQSIPQAIGGAPTQVVSDIYNAIESRKLKYLAPMGLRNIVSAQEYGKRGIKMSGRQLIPTEEKYLEEMEKYKRGEIKIKPQPPVTAGEKLAKSLSFQPLRVSEAYEKEKSRLFISAQTSDIIQNEVRDEIVPLIQTGKDLEARQKFIKLYEKVQKNNPMTDWQKERITDVDKFISQFVLNRLDDEDRETVKDWKDKFIIKGQRSKGRSTSRNIGRSTGTR